MKFIPRNNFTKRIHAIYDNFINRHMKMIIQLKEKLSSKHPHHCPRHIPKK